MNHFTHFLLTFLLIVVVAERAEAQVNHKQKRRTVVKRETKVYHAPHKTRVVHVKVNRKAQVRYVGMPRWGNTVTVVPASTVVIRHRNNPYYYNSGIYYVQRPNGYVVVRPARGLRIRTLPIGYRPVVIGPRNYYYYYGTFYSQVPNSVEYVVTDPPVGAVVDALPEGYEVTTINNVEYYVLDGVYYKEVEDNELEDGVGYEVVKF